MLRSSTLKSNDPERKLRFHTVRLIMTQLVSSTNEKIGESKFVDCLKWTDLGEDEAEVQNLL
jgi:hypothetical protein